MNAYEQMIADLHVLRDSHHNNGTRLFVTASDVPRWVHITQLSVKHPPESWEAHVTPTGDNLVHLAWWVVGAIGGDALTANVGTMGPQMVVSFIRGRVNDDA